jgi:uncharacterized membrane protein HdeD (DUF308 family)
MIRALINNWWLVLLRGLFALAFATFIVFLQPIFPSLLLKPMAYTAVAELFGLLAVIMGIITIFAAARGSTHHRDLWMLLADGVAVTAGGLAVILLPSITVLHVIQIIAAAALVIGAIEILAGTHLRRHVRDEWFLIAGGVTSLLFSVFLFIASSVEIPSLLNWIAVYAAANGLAMVGLAHRLHGLRHTIHEFSSPEHLAQKKKAGAA